MEIKRFETGKRMSKAVINNGLAYLCGQVANDYSKDIVEQTISTLENVEEILKALNTEKKNILSATIYIKNMSMFAKMNSVWDNWVEEGFAPARACVEANMADENILVEVSIVATV